MIRNWLFNRKVAKSIETDKRNCAQGNHIPVKGYAVAPYVRSDDDTYFCQECVKNLTREDWLRYFGRKEDYEDGQRLADR